jgi:hypothetical protein
MNSTLHLKGCTQVQAPIAKPLAVPPVPLQVGEFWFIWRLGSCRPRQRHSSLAAAVAERDRLLLQNPDGEFLIFRAVEIDLDAFTKDASTTNTKGGQRTETME